MYTYNLHLTCILYSYTLGHIFRFYMPIESSYYGCVAVYNSCFGPAILGVVVCDSCPIGVSSPLA